MISNQGSALIRFDSLFGRKRGMFPGMVEPQDGFVFEPRKIGDEWQFRVHCPGAEISYIHGFASKAAAFEWLAGVGRPSWIKGWNEAA